MSLSCLKTYYEQILTPSAHNFKNDNLFVVFLLPELLNTIKDHWMPCKKSRGN